MLLRAFLAIEPAPLRRRIAALIEEPAVVSLAGGAEVLHRALSGESCDLGLVGRELLGDDPSSVVDALLRLPDRPELIVLRAGEHGEDRAALLAAGCLAVLDHRLPNAVLGEALRALVDRRRQTAIDRYRAGSWRRRVTADPVAVSPQMRRLLATARRIAGAPTPVLLLGETGVGKEWLARQIHALGPRAAERFLAVNCAAIPEQLIESELFGHVKGAFTGADRARRGCFELAHRGTLLLDEIGEMPVPLQSRLLRVLEEREVRRVGAEESLPIDVRVIAATSRDLAQARGRGSFRDDLYFRLAVITLEIPPLRERAEDLEPLVRLFLHRAAERLGRPPCELEPEALGLFRAYPWPGNARELAGAIERMVLLADGRRLGAADVQASLPAGVAHAGRGTATADLVVRLQSHSWTERSLRSVREDATAEVERRYLEAQLRACGGRIAETARRAGITPRSLNRMMSRLGLRKEVYLKSRAEVAELRRPRRR